MLERTFGLVKTGALDRQMLPEIMRTLRLSHLRVIADRPFGEEIAGGDIDLFRQLYAEHQGKPYYDGLIDSVRRASIGMILEGHNAVRLWRDMMGPTCPARARVEKRLSMRARFGGDAMPDNGFHGSDSLAAAEREIALFFPEAM